VDDIIIFRPLSHERHRADRRYSDQRRVEKLLADRKLTIEVTPAAKQLLVAEGYDPVYGARPLKRRFSGCYRIRSRYRCSRVRFAEGDRIRVDPREGREFAHVRTDSGGRRQARVRACLRAWPPRWNRRGSQHPRTRVPIGAVVMRGDEDHCEAHNETVARRIHISSEFLPSSSGRSRRLRDRPAHRLQRLYVTIEPCAQLRGRDRAGESEDAGVWGVR